MGSGAAALWASSMAWQDLYGLSEVMSNKEEVFVSHPFLPACYGTSMKPRMMKKSILPWRSSYQTIYMYKQIAGVVKADRNKNEKWVMGFELCQE